jgi:hypothetical protein
MSGSVLGMARSPVAIKNLQWNFSATILQLNRLESCIIRNADQLLILYRSGMGRAGFEPAKA